MNCIKSNFELPLPFPLLFDFTYPEYEKINFLKIIVVDYNRRLYLSTKHSLINPSKSRSKALLDNRGSLLFCLKGAEFRS